MALERAEKLKSAMKASDSGRDLDKSNDFAEKLPFVPTDGTNFDDLWLIFKLQRLNFRTESSLSCYHKFKIRGYISLSKQKNGNNRKQ
jgi:hypothetical protein